MFYMGDKYGHTRKGNNNTHCHDSEVGAHLLSHLRLKVLLFMNSSVFEHLWPLTTFQGDNLKPGGKISSVSPFSFLNLESKCPQ